jgi:excinuclease UvrABC nuclease subunit
MVAKYQGHYHYNKPTVTNWKPDAIGVYYCGYPANNGGLNPLYIGKGTSEGGIRARLLSHLDDDYWPDVTHFGYCICSTLKEAENFEAQEIYRCKPKYNQQGK